LELAEKAASLSRDKREEAAKAISAKKESFKLFCDELFVECERGQVSTEIWTREELAKIRTALTEDFVHNLRARRGELKKWAEEDFPYQAKREIPRRIRDQFGPRLEARLATFAANLEKKASESVSSSDFALPPFSFATPRDIAGFDVDDRQMRRIQTGATIAKVAAVPVAMLGLLLINGPVGLAYGIGAAATAGVGVLGSKLAEDKTSELRTAIEHQVEDEFSRLFDEQSDKAVELVKKAFAQIRSMLESRLKSALDSALEALKADSNESAESPSADFSGFRTKLADIQKRLLRSANN
jgi:hypothetical protein